MAFIKHSSPKQSQARIGKRVELCKLCNQHFVSDKKSDLCEECMKLQKIKHTSS